MAKSSRIKPGSTFSPANILIAVVLVAVVAWTLFPFLFAIRNSFMELARTYEPVFIPWLQFQP
jgi:ABC-type glycerol-3-phosphate transport system permease component